MAPPGDLATVRLLNQLSTGILQIIELCVVPTSITSTTVTKRMRFMHSVPLWINSPHIDFLKLKFSCASHTLENYHSTNTVFLVIMLMSCVGGVFILFALVALCYRSVVVHKNFTLCLRLVSRPRGRSRKTYFSRDFPRFCILAPSSVGSYLLITPGWKTHTPP